MAGRGVSRRRFLAGVGVVAAGAVSAGPSRGAPEPAPGAGPGVVRFGVTAQQGTSYGDLLRFWRSAEELGFDSAFVYDHFMAPAPGTPAAERCLEAWSLLAALAAKTRRIRLGVLVSGITYRHPAVLAKMAATVDQVSGGRLILGMGAGWLEREHVAYGIPFHTRAGRAQRLAEAVEVVKQLFTVERATFAGRYFTLKDAPLEPKPVQKPYPPILIGGVGPKVVQPLAARHAQIWHFMARGNDPAEVRRLCDGFDRICRDLGRDPAEVEKATSVDGSPAAGPSQDLAARLRALTDAGVRHFVLLPPPGNDRAVLRRFAEEVMPEVRRR